MHGMACKHDCESYKDDWMHLWHVWSSFILAPDVNKSSFSSCSLVEILKKERKKKVYDLFCQWAMKFINNKNFFFLFSVSLISFSLHSTLSMMFVDNANWINQLNKIYWFIIVSCCVWEWWRNFLLSKTSEDFNSVNWSDID